MVTARLSPRKERSYTVNALRTAPPFARSPTAHQFWCTPRISCCPGLNPLSGTWQGCSSHRPCNGCFLGHRRLCRTQDVSQSPLRYSGSVSVHKLLLHRASVPPSSTLGLWGLFPPIFLNRNQKLNTCSRPDSLRSRGRRELGISEAATAFLPSITQQKADFRSPP